MANYLTYCRVSVNEKQSGANTLEAQRQVIDSYLSAQGVIAAEQFVDSNVSASIPLKNRKVGKRLCALAAAGDCVVVCTKQDRLFRSVEDTAVTLGEWLRAGTKLVSVTEMFDFSNMYGRFQIAIMSAFAELEREMIGQRTRDVFSSLKARGLRYNADAPYGWRYAGETLDAKGKRRGGILQKDAKEQEALRHMKKLHTSGWSLREIAKQLDHLGYKPRRGGVWIHTVVKKCLDEYKERTRRTARCGAGESGVLPESLIASDSAGERLE